MASPVGKLYRLNKFMALNETFGYVEDVETAYQVLREFETSTTTRFCSFYSKDFGKPQDKGKRKSHALARSRQCSNWLREVIFGCCVTNTHDDCTISPEVGKLI